MGISRFFSGSRDSGNKGGVASNMMREQLRKGKKLDFSENYKTMLQKKLAEAKLKAMHGEKPNFSMIGKGAPPPQRSKRAQDIIAIITKREQEKEAKKAAKAVTVIAQRLNNGRIDDKGRIFDSAGNIVGKVNLKNGQMSTVYGQTFGRYVQKSHLTKMAIEQAINKNSPFLINQRRMQDVRLAEQRNAEAQAATNNSLWGAPQYDIWGNLM